MASDEIQFSSLFSCLGGHYRCEGKPDRCIPCHEGHQNRIPKIEGAPSRVPSFWGFLLNLSRFVPVRALALRTDAGFDFTFRIAGNPFMLAPSAPEAPDRYFYFRHTREYTTRIILLASSILLDKYIPSE
jgi:hypothetical protein